MFLYVFICFCQVDLFSETEGRETGDFTNRNTFVVAKLCFQSVTKFIDIPKVLFFYRKDRLIIVEIKK